MRMIGVTKKYVYTAIACALVIVLLFIGYYWFTSSTHDHNTPKDSPVKITTPQKTVTIKNTDKNTSSYQYVPKVSPVDNDVEVVSTPKPLIVSVNGQRHELPTNSVKETHKMENGKLVVTEEREVKLDLKVPEQPRFKKGVYLDSDKKAGVRASYQTESFDVDLKADLWAKDKNDDKKVLLTATKWF